MKIKIIWILLVFALCFSAVFAEDALFYVSNAAGDTIFAVYPSGIKVKNSSGNDVFSASNDSVRFYLNDQDRGSRGGFAIGGTGSVRSNGNTYFNLSPDSIRFYIKENTSRGSRGGFAIGGTGSVRDNGETYFNLERSQTPEVISPSKARMLWYPTKEAFRVGKVLITSSDSVGTNSIATGYESKATGDWSQAFGYKSYARGDYSTAIGKETDAEGTDAFALGYQARALGTGSYAFGSVPRDSLGNPVPGYSGATAEADHSLAFGLGTTSSNIGALSTGVMTTSSGFASTAMGYRCEAEASAAFAAGNRNTASASSSVALGVHNTASNNASVAAGSYNNASGYVAVALGDDNTASGSRSVAIGTGNNVQGYGSAAIGEDNNITHERGYAMGIGNTTSEYGAISFGEYNTASGRASVAMGQNSISSGSTSTTSGRQNEASGTSSVAMGETNTASGDYSVAMGRACEATGDYSVALGSYVTADSMYAVAMGNNTHSLNNYATSFGNSSTASGHSSFAAGYNNTASGYNSVAMGSSNDVSGSYSVSLGYYNNVTGQESAAMGSEINVTGSNAVGLGKEITLDGFSAIGLGYNINDSNGLGSGCFFFGDYSPSATPLTSTSQNQFVARARGGYRFYTTSNYNQRYAVSIQSYGGAMGIGTTSPRHKLNVVDSVAATDGSDGAFIDIENNNNGTGVTSGIRFKNGTTNDHFKGGIFFQDATSYGRGNLIFATDGVSDYHDVKASDADLTIEYDGSVCVGTTSSSRKFFVNGTAGGTTSWYNDSDKRLKKDIKTIKNPLQKVMKLRGVNFKWKDEKRGNKTQMGFIAQEAEKVIPEVVDKSDKYYSMQYAPVTALLVEAIKELKKENDNLKARLEKLEKEMATKQRMNK